MGDGSQRDGRTLGCKLRFWQTPFIFSGIPCSFSFFWHCCLIKLSCTADSTEDFCLIWRYCAFNYNCVPWHGLKWKLQNNLQTSQKINTSVRHFPPNWTIRSTDNNASKLPYMAAIETWHSPCDHTCSSVDHWWWMFIILIIMDSSVKSSVGKGQIVKNTDSILSFNFWRSLSGQVGVVTGSIAEYVHEQGDVQARCRPFSPSGATWQSGGLRNGGVGMNGLLQHKARVQHLAAASTPSSWPSCPNLPMWSQAENVPLHLASLSLEYCVRFQSPLYRKDRGGFGAGAEFYQKCCLD